MKTTAIGWDTVPLGLCIVLLVVDAVRIVRLTDDRAILTLGPPRSYRVEKLGTGLGPVFRVTTDGWTSNVGTKEHVLRQAWEHRERSIQNEVAWRTVE